MHQSNKHMHRWKWVLMAWPIAIILVSGMIYAVVQHRETLPVYGQLEEWNTSSVDTQFVSHYVFVDQQRQPVSLKSFPDKVLVVNFFFTRCPNVCPRMMHDLAEVVEQFKADDRVQFISLSVDPEYDTPEQLQHYASSLNLPTRHWALLTGDKGHIYRAAVVGFHVSASSGDGNIPDFIHTDKIMLVDPDGRIRGYYSGIVKREMDLLTQDIKKLEHE
ncbi:SCO family protein [Thermoflavifilum thermophilum]|uniref:Protein SCO1/2 n=1 Tax=Thermoflavifilum thermophilum TaxID=1393122 RepID=A0A1I7MY22_9BACT|nr:SCO family protein [Thermoflavifilum thermophilum]SFV27312.1 protein SCO1/2 [Thermoflavifilum thermophilum]